MTKIDDIKDWNWVINRVSFIKAAVAHVEQKRRQSAVQGGTFLNDQGKHTYVTFQWQGEELVVDNTNVCHLWIRSHPLLGRSHQVSRQDGVVT